jgi:hypothetical protein
VAAGAATVWGSGSSAAAVAAGPLGADWARAASMRWHSSAKGPGWRKAVLLYTASSMPSKLVAKKRVPPAGIGRCGMSWFSSADRRARTAAFAAPALAEFLLGGSQVREVVRVAVALDLPPHVRQEVFGPVAAEACADPAVGSPHAARHPDGRGLRWRQPSAASGPAAVTGRW